MTLAQLLALDPAAMWDALPRERQMAIVIPLLMSEFANVVAEDDGTDASNGDQIEAARIEQASFQDAMDAIEEAFPDILADDLTALRCGPTADMIDGFGNTAVKGLQGRRKLHGRRDSSFIKLDGKKVEIVGWKNIGTKDAPIWEGWTERDVGVERVQRHPDQFIGPRLLTAPSAADEPEAIRLAA